MHHLTERYFKDQCTHKALEEILTWFQTPEGQDFLSRQIKKDWQQLLGTDDLPLKVEPAAEEIFSRIQQSKENPSRTHWILQWLPSFFLIATVTQPLYQKSVGMYGLMLTKGISTNIISLSDSYLC